MADLKTNLDARIADARKELVSSAQEHEWKAARAENAAKETLQDAQRQFGARGQQILLDFVQTLVEQFNIPEPDPSALPNGISPLVLTLWGHSAVRAQLMIAYAKSFPEPSDNFKQTLLHCLKASLPVYEGMVQPDPITDFADKVAVLTAMAAKWGVLSQYPLPNSSRAWTFQDAADEVKSHFNPVYDALREQSGGVLNHDTGRFGPNGFDDAVSQIKNAKKVIYSPSPASTDALKQAETELAEGTKKLDDLFGNNDAYKEAQAGWSKASTLEDLHDSIDKSFTEPAGVRASGITRGSLGEINPKKFVARANKAIDEIGPDKLKAAMGSDAYNDLVTIRSEMDNMLSDEAYGKQTDRLVREYASKLPKGSVGRTASTMLLTVLAGASIGATTGGVKAGLSNEGVSSGAAQGALIGGVLGASASLPISAAHWLYTHPNQAVAVLKAAKGGAQPIAQTAKQVAAQGITHVFDEKTGTVMPVQ